MKIRRTSRLKKVFEEAVQAGIINAQTPNLLAFNDDDLSAYLYFSTLDREEIKVLHTLFSEQNETLEREHEYDMNQVIRYLKFILSLPNNPKDFPAIGRLNNIPAALGELAKSLERGWVYRTEHGVPLPYLITGATYYPHDPRTETPAHVDIHLYAYQAKFIPRLEIKNDEIKGGKGGTTLIELLSKNGFVLENTQLNEAHDNNMSLYNAMTTTDHQLFDLKNEAEYHSSDWTSRAGQVTGQLILDLEHRKKNRGRENEKPPTFTFWGDERRPQPPLHPYLYGFFLNTHEYGSILVNHVVIHQFKHQAHQIVLKPLHRRLIDILTSHLGVLGDIIEGKNEGTTIIAIGPPGLGKTLTAEIYAEETQRPLYKVHSGQLGKNGESIEKNLKVVFDRASRWNAVLLIDEADTYVRERGDDVNQNTIVASFLRAMEYFKGLLFMTSNRRDIDDAILSRASAIIEYENPDLEERKALWRLHSKNLNASLSEELIDELSRTYDTSGRDVLNLLKLAKRVAEKEKRELSIDIFNDTAPFKRIRTVQPSP